MARRRSRVGGPVRVRGAGKRDGDQACKAVGVVYGRPGHVVSGASPCSLVARTCRKGGRGRGRLGRDAGSPSDAESVCRRGRLAAEAGVKKRRSPCHRWRLLWTDGEGPGTALSVFFIAKDEGTHILLVDQRRWGELARTHRVSVGYQSSVLHAPAWLASSPSRSAPISPEHPPSVPHFHRRLRIVSRPSRRPTPSLVRPHPLGIPTPRLDESEISPPPTALPIRLHPYIGCIQRECAHKRVRTGIFRGLFFGGTPRGGGVWVSLPRCR